MINVFIVGSKGIPAKYGGFETFVENLTKYKKSDDVRYFVSCMTSGDVFSHNKATCFPIETKKDNAYHRMISVHNALKWVEDYITNKTKHDSNIICILGCRIGLLIRRHARRLHKLDCKIVVNPDGLEWKRDKWNNLAKKILLLSEKRLIKYSDYIVCDSLGIVDYVKSTYKFYDPSKIGYIAYGSDIKPSKLGKQELQDYLKQFGCSPKEYYLVVGRFVPENNFELMIKEFMNSKTSKKLLIISNIENNSFLEEMRHNLKYEDDSRIIFAGTLYDEELLKSVRENAYCYLHGHSVGGTNPSLLEALSYTKVNLLFDVCFNKEVGIDQCLYFDSKSGNLSKIIDSLDDENYYKQLCKQLNPRAIIEERFSWDKIVDEYENLFKSL